MRYKEEFLIFFKRFLSRYLVVTVNRTIGFDRDENAVSVFWADGEKRFPTTDKSALANELVELVIERYYVVRGADTQPRLTVISTND